jgi:hypothetical protein
MVVAREADPRLRCGDSSCVQKAAWGWVWSDAAPGTQVKGRGRADDLEAGGDASALGWTARDTKERHDEQQRCVLPNRR